MSLLLTLLLIFTRFSNIYIVNFEHVIAGWVTDVYNHDSQTAIARFFLNDDRNTRNISKKKKEKKILHRSILHLVVSINGVNIKS